MFYITIPASRAPEHRYILKVILEEFLGLHYRVEESGGGCEIQIRLEGDTSGRSTVVAENLLCRGEGWLKPESLPQISLPMYVPPAELRFESGYSVPAMFGGGAPEVKRDATVVIEFDLFGSAFFLLTRYEEVVLDCRDDHGRFPARDSAMAKAGALDRPLVDEYTEILRRAIGFCWPETSFKTRVFKIVPTHDVDWPYEYLFLSSKRILERCAARLVRGRSLTRACESFRTWRRVRSGDDLADPFFGALVRIMDMSEAAGLVSRFYFLAGRTNSRFDADYEIEHPRIRRLLRMIDARGHLIGLHPSYGTLGKLELLKEELTRLRRVCEEENIKQSIHSVRSHYLRWDPRRSLRDFDAAGFHFDSTLAFAERAGFRCGTCHEFGVFDVVSRESLSLREQPLTVMELSLLDSRTQNLSHEEAANVMSTLKARCKLVGGQYIFLWHNSRLQTAQDWELYQQQITWRMSVNAL